MATTLNPSDKASDLALSNGDLTVTKINHAPVDIALANLVSSGMFVPTATPVSTALFTISGTDPDPGESATLTFSEVADPDDKFTVSGTTVTLAAGLSEPASHALTLRATDIHGATYDELFTIVVGSPVLTGDRLRVIQHFDEAIYRGPTPPTVRVTQAFLEVIYKV